MQDYTPGLIKTTICVIIVQVDHFLLNLRYLKLISYCTYSFFFCFFFFCFFFFFFFFFFVCFCLLLLLLLLLLFFFFCFLFFVCFLKKIILIRPNSPLVKMINLSSYLKAHFKEKIFNDTVRAITVTFAV